MSDEESKKSDATALVRLSDERALRRNSQALVSRGLRNLTEPTIAPVRKPFSNYKEWLTLHGIRINSDQDTGDTYKQYRREDNEQYGEYYKAIHNWSGTQTEANMTPEEFMAEYKRKYPESFNENGTFSLTKARAAAERRFSAGEK
jgi:hypothetical protein